MKMKEFKVGDIVTIVSGDWIKENCSVDREGLYSYKNNDCYFAPEMLEYCDEKFKIMCKFNYNEEDNFYTYELEGIGNWVFVFWMFKENHIPYRRIIKDILNDKKQEY